MYPRQLKFEPFKSEPERMSQGIKQELKSYADTLPSDTSDQLPSKLSYKSERTIILMPIMKIEYTEYQPAKARKHCPTYKDMDSGKKNQYCSVCRLYFNRAPGHPRNMHNHIMNEHTLENADGTYSCRLCEKISITRVAVKKHFDQTHRMFDKPKICHLCGAELMFYGTAAKHYATHRERDKSSSTTELRECKECEIQFTTKTAFYLHRKSFQ